MITVQPPADIDADGMADDWETAHGVTDPNADPDGDGEINLQEYCADTDPNDDQSWLRITAFSGDPGSGYTVTWAAVGAVRYRLQFSDGDAGGKFNGAFTPLVRPVTDEMAPGAVGAATTMNFLDDFALTGAPANGNRFYRVGVVK
jgi:hypothetical protein